MEQEEENHGSLEITTAGLLNGDMGCAERSDDLSPPHVERTVSERNAENNAGNKAETEQRTEEASTNHNVGVCLFSLSCPAASFI